jgi:hypothetical protein
MRGARSGGITADCRFEAKNLSTSPSPTTRPQYQILRNTLRATEALIESVNTQTSTAMECPWAREPS